MKILKYFSYIFMLYVLMLFSTVLVSGLSLNAGFYYAPADTAVLVHDLPQTSNLDITPLDTITSGDSTDVSFDGDTVVRKKENAFKFRVKYKATDSVRFDMVQNRVYLYRQSQVNYDDIELKAYKTEFDMTSKVIYATGGRDSVNNYFDRPVVNQGGTEYEADSMSYNFDSQKALIYSIRTQQGEGFLHASKAKRFPDGSINMTGGKYTTCPRQQDPHFYLSMKEGKVIPGSQVIFRYGHMVLLDIPLYMLALPFGFFPQTNKEAVSGVIPPTYGMEISRGLNLTNGGYYFAFNDHIDAQIMGDIYSTGTWRTMVTSRYIQRYKFSGSLNMSYGVTVAGEKGLDQTKATQYQVQWSHRQDAKANPFRTFSASVNYSSSKYDREFNFHNSNALYNNTKNSSIQFSKRWPNTPLSFSTSMRANQVSTTGMVNIDFPNFNFRMDRIYPFRKKEPIGKAKWYEDIALQYDASLQNSLSGQEDDLFSDKNIRNMKNGFQHKVPLSINFKVLKFFNITPSVNYTGVMYTSRIKSSFNPDSIGSNNSMGVTVTDTIRGLFYAHALSPSMSVSMTPKFYLMNVYGPTSKVEAIRTVISPTVGVSYVPDLSRWFNYNEPLINTSTGEQMLKRDGKPDTYSIFRGQGTYTVPTVPGQSGSVNFGVNGNVEMKVRGNDSIAQSRKVKILNNISATSRYNIFADSMKFDIIGLSANTTLFGLNLTANGRINPYKLTPVGTRIDKWGPQLTNASFNTGISFPLNREKNKEEKNPELDYNYFDVPWNISFSYGLTYSKPQFESKLSQNLSFSGNINFTKNWSLNFSSSYDFDAKKIAYTSASINRDLCCWQMSMNFSPFGVYKFYFFKINVKSATLQDLKYEQRKTANDFMRHRW